MRVATILPALLLLTAPAAARAQSADHRFDASIGVGYAKTWDDEESMGNGASVSGDAIFRVTPRLGLGVAVERVSHTRDIGGGAMTFEGRSMLASARAQFRFGAGAVQPIVHAGFGVLDYSGKTTSAASNGLPAFTLPIEGSHRGLAPVASGGAALDFFIAPRVSVRPGLTVHMTRTDDGSLPWMIWRSGVSMALHW